MTVKDADPDRVGRRFSGAATELALAGYPGPPPDRAARGGHRLRRLLAGPGARPTWSSPPSCTPTARRVEVPHHGHRARRPAPRSSTGADASLAPGVPDAPDTAVPAPTRAPSAPTGGGTVGCRSAPSSAPAPGDKGGNANVGLWARLGRGLGVARRPSSPSSASAHLLPEADGPRGRSATPSPTCGPSTSWWWACSARASPRRPDPTPRPRAWASTCGSRTGRPPAPGPPASAPEAAQSADADRRSDRPDRPAPTRRQPWTSPNPTSCRCSARRSAHRRQVRPRATTSRRPTPTSAPTSCGTRWPSRASSGSTCPRSTAAAAVASPSWPRWPRSWPPHGCPLLVIVVSPAICATIIAKFGTEAQKQRWLPRFATGELKMAFAITEPDAGSNSHNLGLTATKDGDIYRLNGHEVLHLRRRRVRGHPGGDQVRRRPRHRAGPPVPLRRRHRHPRPRQAGPARRDHRPREAVHPVLRQRRRSRPTG